MYLDLEKEMADFLSYVPLEKSHSEVYSPKLVKIILQVGPEILNAFNLAIGNINPTAKIDEMFGMSDLSNDLSALWTEEAELRSKKQSLSFKKYYAFLEKYGFNKPSKAEVQLREKNSLILTPFKEDFPNWWAVYNSLKHDKYNNLSSATLFTTLMCLGALFWMLDCCAEDLYIDDGLSSNLFLRKAR